MCQWSSLRLKSLLEDVPSYDCSTINAWEDVEFKQAVEATGRKKLIICGLWTEACLAFPTLDALQEGYEVYPVVDAVGGTSQVAHETALRRVEQAGAQLTSIAQLACELQRNWARPETSRDFLSFMIQTGLFQNM
ncbi:isochorismatase family protein [Secundilactobacillus oryzae JCM 18671]|uniref:Isochorismatase family protein n=1 Tax=Secundilactobacillus oryzae JCM 18671 TaxID=1291743 RepID=A0A081BII3_9LACO|nr:isochorismatase family protein [Secundilactobacillus oryzae JCM 18671]